MVGTGSESVEVLAHGGIGVQRFGEFHVGLADLEDGVLHAPSGEDLDLDRGHAEVLLDVLGHGVGVVDKDTDVMYKLEHLSPLMSEGR